jgi:hypothetical protein
VIYFGYKYIQKEHKKKIEAEYTKYAAAISEISIAVELYRNYPDSFLLFRDSILNKHNLTMDSIENFRAKLDEDKAEWAKVWSNVKTITDSLVGEYQFKIKDETSDSMTDSVYKQ